MKPSDKLGNREIRPVRFLLLDRHLRIIDDIKDGYFDARVALNAERGNADSPFLVMVLDDDRDDIDELSQAADFILRRRAARVLRAELREAGLKKLAANPKAVRKLVDMRVELSEAKRKLTWFVDECRNKADTVYRLRKSIRERAARAQRASRNGSIPATLAKRNVLHVVKSVARRKAVAAK